MAEYFDKNKNENKKNILKKISDEIEALFARYNRMTISRAERIMLLFVIVSFVFTIAIIIISVFAISNQIGIKELQSLELTVPTKIYDINGELISEIFLEKRDLITYEDLPDNLIKAIVAVEDTKFFKHFGIDLYGMVRAVVVNTLSMKKAQGASTLTQQVARGLLLTKKKTWTRKIKEIWISFQIERKYTKEEIMVLYFNQIFFGHSVYGVQAASRFYFGKNVNDLNLSECALLATLPPSPNAYSPINNPNRSMERHKIVLKRMADLRYITKEEAETAYNDFWATFTLNIKAKGTTAFADTTDYAPYVTEYVRRMLVEKYGEKRVKEDGLKVYTTIDLKKQMAAQRILSDALLEENIYYDKTSQNVDSMRSADILDRMDMLSILFDVPYNISEVKLPYIVGKELNKTVLLPNILLTSVLGLNDVNNVLKQTMQQSEDIIGHRVEGALVSINPKNSYIVSMVGGSGFTPRNQLNRATQARRQAGSAFKPFLYAYALETRTFNPASIIVDAPIGYPLRDTYWTPQNYNGKFSGPVTLRRALSSSINIVSLKILDSIGVVNTIDYVKPIFNVKDADTERRMFNRDLTLALGTGVFTPLELTTGFAVFANEGKEVNPIMVRYVTDRYGVMIDNFEEEQKNEIASRGGVKQVVARDTSYIITSMLRDVVTGGTASGAVYSSKFSHPAAGKTGTSSDWKDAWFIGYNPNLVTGVWLGFDNFDYSLGRDRAGGKISTPIWANYMKAALEDEPKKWFAKPGGIVEMEVCAESGLLPTASCIKFNKDMFLKGSTPISECNICSSSKRQSDEEDEILKSLLNRD